MTEKPSSGSTHHDGQVRTECPQEDCSYTIRMRPFRGSVETDAYCICGSCGEKFFADRRSGEVVGRAEEL